MFSCVSSVAMQVDFDSWAEELRACGRVSRASISARFEVTVGACATIEALVSASEARGCGVDWDVRKLLPMVNISGREVLKIATPTVRELGFTDAWTPIRHIHIRGIVLGYGLVPRDLAFSLGCVYLEQPMNEVIFMAMHALNHPRGGPVLLDVDHTPNGRLVGCHSGYPGALYHLDHRFAFVVRQAQSLDLS